MKQILTSVILMCFAGLSCKKSSTAEFEYVKVMTVFQTSQITQFNKGYKLDDYFLFDALAGEAKFRVSKLNYSSSTGYYPADPDTIFYYQGEFQTARYLDTLNMLVSVLKRDKNGPITTPEYPEGALFCGRTYFTEFKDKSGTHFHIISAHNNDTLKMFEKFFLRLRERGNWSPNAVANDFINDSVEMVQILKGSGYYQELPLLYFPPKCDSSVDFGLLYGKWRTEGDRYTGRYWLQTIDSSGNWIFDRIYEDSISRKYIGKIKSVQIKDKVVRVRVKGKFIDVEMLVLSKTCMKFRVKGTESISEYYRVN
ncbi:MAG: hypothetical protein WBP58_15285 [Chitinophagaceae bacterium]